MTEPTFTPAPAPAPRSGYSWAAAWPCYLVAIFAALGLARLAPAGAARAVLAVPVLFSVPGALTLGALLLPGEARGRKPFDPVAFGCLAAVLSAIWLGVAAVALSVAHILISATSMYVCLLLSCALLATAAQLRLRRNAATAPDALSAPAEDPPWPRGRAVRHAAPPRGRPLRYALAGGAAGLVLLAGGAYAYIDGPHPAPVGYTWLAWSGARADGVIAVGPSGLALPFQINHQQPGTARFTLTAAWTGGGQAHQLVKPVTVVAGADKTVGGTLAIPQPAGSCAYRVVVTLAETGRAHPQTWSINADVRAKPRAGRAPGGCAS